MRLRSSIPLFIYAAIIALSLASTVLQDIANVEAQMKAEGSLILINGKSVPTTIDLNFQDSDSDGYPDTAEINVRNEGDMTLKAKIVNVNVSLNDHDFLVERTGNGIWSFYEDVDSNGLDAGDIKIGEVKIYQGSSSLDENVFTVKSNYEKTLKVELKFEPYAAPGNYTVSFSIVSIHEIK